MEIKIISRILLFIFLVGTLMACSSKTTSEGVSSAEKENSDETITLKFATPSPTESPYAKNTIEPFMDRVTELTNGKVQWDYYPSQQLGNMMDYINLTKDGVTDVAYFAALNFKDEFPISSSLAGLPGLGTTGTEDSLAYHDIVTKSPILETDFLSNGVYPVFVQVSYPFEFISRNKEIRVPSDLKGMQVMGNGGMMNELLEHLGATPVTLTTAEMFEAFDRGVIEAVHAVPSTAEAYGLGELVHSSTNKTGAGAGPVGFMMNLDVWESLPKEIQDAFHKATREISVSGMNVIEEDSAAVLEKWKEDGVEVFDLTTEEKEKWEDAFAEFREKWIAKQGKAFAEAYELYIETLKQYQK